jgi:hypothetical protein
VTRQANIRRRRVHDARVVNNEKVTYKALKNLAIIVKEQRFGSARVTTPLDDFALFTPRAVLSARRSPTGATHMHQPNLLGDGRHVACMKVQQVCALCCWY